MTRPRVRSSVTVDRRCCIESTDAAEFDFSKQFDDVSKRVLFVGRFDELFDEQRILANTLYYQRKKHTHTRLSRTTTANACANVPEPA
jgi:trehalose/maltose hydrolase-like predicted phosphorylase